MRPAICRIIVQLLFKAQLHPTKPQGNQGYQQNQSERQLRRNAVSEKSTTQLGTWTKLRASHFYPGIYMSSLVVSAYASCTAMG